MNFTFFKIYVIKYIFNCQKLRVVIYLVIRQRQLNFLLYGQLGEIFQVGRSVGRQNKNNNPQFHGRQI